MALALTAQSCKDDDFTKHSIDAEYQTGTNTTASAGAAPVVVDYETATLSGSVSGVTDVVEQGFQVSTSEDFSDAIYYANSEAAAEDFSMTISGLEGSTTYYARPYAITAAGGYVFGETQTFTTPRTPIYTIDGVYTVVEYELNDDNKWEVEVYDGEPVIYEIAIDFAEEGNEEDVLISNLNDMGEDAVINGYYDAESQTVEIPSMQVVGEHPSYGPLFFRGVADDISAFKNVFYFQFQTLGGVLQSSPFALCVQAGYFGFYRIAGTHNEIEE